MNNPFDDLEIARDLVRRDECDYLFDRVRKESKEMDGLPARTDYRDGYAAGLDFVMDVLDGRIGYLHDRWG